MALPNEECYPDDDSVCCDMLYEIGSRILDVVMCALADCIPITPCGANELKGYLTVGREVQDPTSDYVAVSLTQANPTPRSMDENGNRKINLLRAQYQVRLLETGWPQPQGDFEDIFYPTPEQYMIAARHSYAHGEVMYRALLVADRLNPYCKRDCYTQIGPLTPVEPRGGSVGWETYVITDYPMASPRQLVP